MNDSKKLISLISILVLVSVTVGGITLYLLYQAAFEQQRQQLLETAKSQARLIEAIGRFDAREAHAYLSNPQAAAIKQIHDAFTHYQGFGDTGEFVLARRDGGHMIFLMRQRHTKPSENLKISLESEIAEPMRYALLGLSGTIIGLDYRNQLVLAAYEPVRELNMGLVAKIDMDEIRAPFVRVAMVAAGVGVLVIVLGAFLFMRVTSPLFRRIQENERALLTLMANLPGMVYRRRNDKERTLEYASEGCKELTGYSISDLLTNKNHSYAQLIHADDRERVWEEVQAAIREDRAFQLTYRITTAMGELKWVWEQGHPLLDSDTGIASVEGFITDITERKWAEESAEESRSELQRVLDSIPVRIFWKDRQSVYLGCNRNFARDAGLETPEELIGITDSELSWRAHTEQYRRDDQEVMDSGMAKFNYEEPQTRTDGNNLWLRMSKIPLKSRDGEIIGLMGCYEDITQYTQTLEALRRSEHLLRTVLETLPIGTWVTDKAGKILMSNNAGRKIWYGREFNKVDDFADAKIYSVETHEPLRPEGLAAKRALSEGVSILDEVVKIECPDGTHNILLNSAVPLRDANQNIIGAILVSQDISESRRVEQELRESAANFSALAENANDGILVNMLGKHVFANRRMSQILGYSVEELYESSIQQLVHPNEYEKVLSRFRNRLENEAVTSQYETTFVAKDGSSVPVEITAAKTIWQGKPAGLVVIRDITARNLAEEEMRKLSSAVQLTADFVMITDRNGIIEYVNPAFEQTTGYSRDEAVGKKSNIVKSGAHHSEFYKNLWETILSGQVYRDVLINQRKNSDLYYEEKTITPLRDLQGRITHFVSTGKDITERMQTQERLHYLAHHDALTDLPNRVLFSERLDHALSRARWARRPLAVMFLDLDRFKIINDTLGHDVGDRALRISSERLRRCVRDGDTVARVGGDEFTILLEDVASYDDVPRVAGKILETLSQPFFVEGREFLITTSIGISLHPDDGDDSQTLLRNSDTAMYRAKERGKNNYQFYSAEMGAKAFERLSLETSLRRALERGELVLYYQPQVDLNGGGICGLEALLRWQHPSLGLMLPDQFLPVAEETGLIIPIDEWVLTDVCRQIRYWNDIGMRAIRVAVNMSSRQFNQAKLSDTIAAILKNSSLDASTLELEITEDDIMDNAKITVETLQKLNDMGLRLAIDDFGTGYSSLSYLKRFPIDTLKIDQSFVNDITNDADDASIVTAIIAMANSLDINVIAEGVETEGQRTFLRNQGCNGMQGYLFSRPLPADKIPALLQQEITS